ncbi:acyl-CoA dehydrogenase family protein [Variovorax sp. KK3]|uniref:acyl-CoA dehydrogenase family protein n=1 Tax=Variovorax sp. KK3 TaxID=1855728 RepID=UPI00097C9EEC|nr:acyl-CoA dehydrogenase family protein [Variovorax sp. KK3]
MPLHATTHPLVKLSPAEAALLARTQALVAEKIGPDAERVAREDVFAWDTFKLLSAEGIVATAFPREHGGSEASMLLRVRIIEELAGACSTAASLITGTDLSSRPIVAGGSDALKRELIGDLASGARQSAFALTEPGAGSDVARLAARYTTSPKGGWVLSGRKKFITRANVADMFVVVARQDDGPAGAKGLSAFVVPRDAKGVSVSPVIPKLGWYGVPIAMVDFENVQVPEGYLLGKEGEGMALAQDTLLRARIGHAAIALGRAAGALTIAAQYANQRQVFGQAVGGHQGIQWMVAEMAAQIEAARCLVYSTALRYDAGDADVAIHASIAKMHATDLCMKIVVDCLQLLGGNGYLKAFPLERFMRDAKMNQIGEGTSEVHKTLIGRHVLRTAGEMPRHPCLDMEPDLWCHG